MIITHIAVVQLLEKLIDIPLTVEVPLQTESIQMDAGVENKGSLYTVLVPVAV
jgi:hypothetical protein